MEAKDKVGNVVYVSYTKDCDDNEDGFFCQVFADEYDNEIDTFCIIPEDCDCTNEEEVEKYIERYVADIDYTEDLSVYHDYMEDEDEDGEMAFERFKDKYYDLSTSEKISMYNDWCAESGYESIEYFDENFFDNFFSDKMEVCRATAYGEVNFSDEYIRLNAYGNLESFGESEALDIIENCLEEIFECKHIWEQYI